MNIEALGELVRKTNALLLPYFGRIPEGPYAELLLNLKHFERNTSTDRLSDSHCVSLIISAITGKFDNTRRNAQRGIPEDTLPINIHTDDNGWVDIVIDINTFEEDYLTLKQYTDKRAEESGKYIAMFRERVRERHAAQIEQRRKERGNAKNT